MLGKSTSKKVNDAVEKIEELVKSPLVPGIHKMEKNTPLSNKKVPLEAADRIRRLLDEVLGESGLPEEQLTPMRDEKQRERPPVRNPAGNRRSSLRYNPPEEIVPPPSKEQILPWKNLPKDEPKRQELHDLLKKMNDELSLIIPEPQTDSEKLASEAIRAKHDLLDLLDLIDNPQSNASVVEPPVEDLKERLHNIKNGLNALHDPFKPVVQDKVRKLEENLPPLEKECKEAIEDPSNKPPAQKRAEKMKQLVDDILSNCDLPLERLEQLKMKEKFNDLIAELEISSSFDRFNEQNLLSAARSLTQFLGEVVSLVDLERLKALTGGDSLLDNLLTDLNSTSPTPLLMAKTAPPPEKKDSKPSAPLSPSVDNFTPATKTDTVFSKIDDNVAQLKVVINIPPSSKGKGLLTSTSDIVVGTAAIAEQLQKLSNAAKAHDRQGLIDSGRRVNELIKSLNKDLQGYTDKANKESKSRLMQIQNGLSNYGVQLKILCSVKAASNQFDKSSDDQMVSMCGVLTEALTAAVPTCNNVILQSK